AAVHQVDDELQLVQALEVRDFGLEAGLDERFEARLDERARAAAEHGLLAEQVGLGLFGERRLDDAGAADADRAAVRQRQGERLTRRVLVHGNERRRAAALDVEL